MAAEAVISMMVERLVDVSLEKIKEEIHLWRGVKERIRNLSNTSIRIRAVLDDAERRKITDEHVQIWLQDLEAVSYEIVDVLDEWNYIILEQEIEGAHNDNALSSIEEHQVRPFISSSWFRFKPAAIRNRDFAVKIEALNEKLDLIENQKNQFRFITSSGVASDSQPRARVQTTSLIDVSEVFGRDIEKNNLVSQLLAESQQEKKNGIQILSIIGTGGIGKTTLAQLAYNDDQVVRCFEKRAWVCVSDPFDEIRVAKAIVESIEPSSTIPNELGSLLQQIRVSTSGKRFLLVFDDVWTEDEMKWEPFKISLKHCAPGSTILLTTRSERVAIVAGATSMKRLGELSDSESWSLFWKIAFVDRTNPIVRQHERLQNIGRAIVKKCRGLPLAIKVLGGLLHFKNTADEWQKVLDSNLWELKGVEDKLFPHFYLSYDDLPFQLRRCFSYCAIFPKDEKIEVDELISIWMGQGYLRSSESEDEMEVKGREYFEHLAMRSFFLDFEKDDLKERIVTCKMHDIVHDFAQFLTKTECVIIERERKVTVSKNTRHLTWLGSRATIDSLSDLNIGQPRTFYLKNLKLETLTSHLLKNLNFVRVLKLDECSLKELPREIGNLIHLRYLGLSNNYLKELPTTIYALYNLQTLNLEGCWALKELPPGIEKLTKLRHLILSVKDMKFPMGIGELRDLQTLYYFSVGGEYNKLGYLKNLNQLQGSLCIHVKDNLDDVTDAKNANLKSKEHIRRLMFKLDPSVIVKEDVMEALEPPPKLEKLDIYYLRTQKS